MTVPSSQQYSSLSNISTDRFHPWAFASTNEGWAAGLGTDATGSPLGWHRAKITAIPQPQAGHSGAAQHNGRISNKTHPPSPSGAALLDHRAGTQPTPAAPIHASIRAPQAPPSQADHSTMAVVERGLPLCVYPPVSEMSCFLSCQTTSFSLKDRL